MSAKPTNGPTAEDLTAAIPTCALDEAGRLRQYARYQHLATSVRGVQHEREAVVVQFDDRFDRDLLERALAVERECCPFFVFQFEESQQRLAITVRATDQLPALEAIAAAFATVRPTSAEPEAGA